jgi:hypothetical protein
VLKAALDDNEERTISWMSTTSTFNPNGMDDEAIYNMIKDSGQYPNNFTFYGQVIFISNYKIDSIDSALKSRSVPIDISPTYDEFLDIIQSNLEGIAPKVPLNLKREVFAYFNSKDKGINKADFNLRTFVHAVSFRMNDPENWKSMLQYV